MPTEIGDQVIEREQGEDGQAQAAEAAAETASEDMTAEGGPSPVEPGQTPIWDPRTGSWVAPGALSAVAAPQAPPRRG
jgi:hypothetical protein